MTELTEAMREAARAWVSEYRSGSLDVRIERESVFSEGMAHAVELILADLAERSDRPETPATANVQVTSNAVHGAKKNVRVRLRESGRQGQCYGEPSVRTAVLIATDRALIQERIANGEWLKK